MKPPRSLGDLQLAIMAVLWERGEAAVADVHEALLPSRGLAPTTIATMLRKMEVRGLVAHRTEGRQFVYRTTVDRGSVHRSMVADLVERLFGGDHRALVNHLIVEGEIDASELDALRDEVDAASRRKEDDR